jgi:hypothetical protein
LFTPNPTPQNYFHAFSAKSHVPKTPPKTDNQSSINKIRVFEKVIFSYAQSGKLELEIEKAPATAGAFLSPYKLQPVSPLLARFGRK